MKKSLLVYFGVQRTYFAIVEPCKKGFELKYIHSDKFVPDLKSQELDIFSSLDGFKKINDDFGDDITGLNIVVPSHLAHYSIIPGANELDKATFKKISELEIRVNFPNNVYEDFSVNSIPLLNSQNENQYNLMEIIPNSIVNNCKLILSDFNIPIGKISTSAITQLPSFFYNYPEVNSRNSAIISFGIHSTDFSIVSNKSLVYFKQLTRKSSTDIYGNILHEIEKSEELLNTKLENIFLCGEALTPEIINETKVYFRNNDFTINRLNSFRMLTTNLGPDFREYCFRMAHIYPGCIGAGIPDYIKDIEVL